MAKKGIDFSGLAAGADLLANGWSKGWNASTEVAFSVVDDATADGGKAARLTKTGAGDATRDAVKWTAGGDVQYGKAFFRWKVPVDNNGTLEHQGPAIRLHGGATENGVVFYPNQANDTINVGAYVNGTFSSGTAVALAWAADQWLNVLVDFTDTTGIVTYKVWTGDRVTDEVNAVSVSISGTDTTASPVGLSMFRDDSSYDLDFIGFADAGEEAPRSMKEVRYGTSFSGLADGADLLVNGWSRGFSAGNALKGTAHLSDTSWDGGTVARFTRSGTGRESLMWDQAGKLGTGAAFFRWRVTADTMKATADELQGAAIQISGASSAENGIFSFLANQGDEASIGAYHDGTVVSTTAQAFPFAIGEWINMLMDFTADPVVVKFWKGSDRYDETTALSFTTTPRSVGGLGIMHFNGNVTQELDFVGFGPTVAEVPRSMADIGGAAPVDPAPMTGDLVFSPNFDGCNLHPTNSTITNPSTAEPVVRMVPRTGMGSFYNFLGAVEGATSRRPVFELDCNGYVGGANVGSSWRPWYTTTDPSDHTTTWHRWPTAPTQIATGIYQFQLPDTFSVDKVWIGFQIGYPLARAKSVLDWLKATHPTLVRNTTSGGTDNIVGYIASTTDELGRVIPQTPIYSYGIWSDDMPLDGNAKRTAVCLGGVHAGEHVGDFTHEGFIKWLVGGSAKANDLLRNFKFYIYPNANPSGRWGGYRRSSPTTTADPNRDYDLTPQLPETKFITGAWTDDIGAPDSGAKIDAFFAWHGSYHTGEESAIHFFYRSNEAEAAGRFEPILDAYQPVRFQSIAKAGLAGEYTNLHYSTSHSYVVESAERHAVADAGEYTTSGVNVGQALDDTWDQYPTDFGGSPLAPPEGEQFYWTAADYALGASPTDAWANDLNVTSFTIKEDANLVKYLEVVGTDLTRAFLRFLPAGALSADSEIWAKYMAVDANTLVGFSLRTKNTTTETLSDLRAAYVPVNSKERLLEFVDGVGGTAVEQVLTTPINTLGEVRSQAVGTTANARFWEASLAEDTTAWDLTKTVSTLTNAGPVGMFFFRPYTFRIYEFGVGINGASAPKAPVTQTTNNNITAVTSNGLSNSLVPGHTMTITFDALPTAQGQVEVQSADGKYQSILAVTSWDAVNNKVTVDGAIGELPYGITNALLIVEASDGTLIDQQSGISVVKPPYLYEWVNGNSPSYADNSIFKDAVVAPTTDYQIRVEDPNNLQPRVESNGQIIQIDRAGAINVTVWDALDGTVSNKVSYTIYSDAIAPTVQSVEVPAAKTYKAGDALNFIVNFSEPVYVDGSPLIDIVLGSIGRNANYSSGSGTSALTFRYVLSTGDVGPVTVGSLKANGATVMDLASNPAVLDLVNIGSTTGIKIDTQAPGLSLDPLKLINGTYAISGTVGDAVSATLKLGLDLTYALTLQPGGVFEQELIGATHGTYNLILEAVDAVGNITSLNQTVTLADLGVAAPLAPSERTVIVQNGDGQPVEDPIFFKSTKEKLDFDMSLGPWLAEEKDTINAAMLDLQVVMNRVGMNVSSTRVYSAEKRIKVWLDSGYPDIVYTVDVYFTTVGGRRKKVSFKVLTHVI